MLPLDCPGVKMKRWKVSAAAAAVLACTALAGCATSTMKSYVGHNVADVALDFGPPANAFDMPDGRRAFQWRLRLHEVKPSYVNEHRQVLRYGEMAWVGSPTPIYGGQPLAGKCVWTLFATWQEAVHGWMVGELRKPPYVCR